MKRKREYEENIFKAYAEVWDRCNKAMQGKLETRTDYCIDNIQRSDRTTKSRKRTRAALPGIKIRNENHNRRLLRIF